MVVHVFGKSGKCLLEMKLFTLIAPSVDRQRVPASMVVDETFCHIQNFVFAIVHVPKLVNCTRKLNDGLKSRYLIGKVSIKFL